MILCSVFLSFLFFPFVAPYHYLYVFFFFSYILLTFFVFRINIAIVCLKSIVLELGSHFFDFKLHFLVDKIFCRCLRNLWIKSINCFIELFYSIPRKKKTIFICKLRNLLKEFFLTWGHSLRANQWYILSQLWIFMRLCIFNLKFLKKYNEFLCDKFAKC